MLTITLTFLMELLHVFTSRTHASRTLIFSFAFSCDSRSQSRCDQIISLFWFLVYLFALHSFVLRGRLTFLAYLMYYLPLIWLLNEESRRICSMLLMLPVEVLEKLHGVKEFMEQLSNSIAKTDDLA
jgi:hypothetical protein